MTDTQFLPFRPPAWWAEFEPAAANDELAAEPTVAAEEAVAPPSAPGVDLGQLGWDAPPCPVPGGDWPASPSNQPWIEQPQSQEAVGIPAS